MDETRFQGLVAFTRQAFMSHHQPELDELPAETRLRVFAKVLPKRGRDEFLHGLIDESAKSKHAWDSVKLIAESLLRRNEPLPVELRQWIADVLADQYTPSDKRRPRPTKGGSACDVVGAAVFGTTRHRYRRRRTGPGGPAAVPGPALVRFRS